MISVHCSFKPMTFHSMFRNIITYVPSGSARSLRGHSVRTKELQLLTEGTCNTVLGTSKSESRPFCNDVCFCVSLVGFGFDHTLICGLHSNPNNATHDCIYLFDNEDIFY
jgi:hypothetical protein